MTESENSFSFVPINDRVFETCKNSEYSDKWEKWGLSHKTVQLQSFTFDNIFKRGMGEDFLKSLLSCPEFQYQFRVGDGRGGTLQYPNLKAKKIDYVELTTQSISLDLFNPALQNEEIVRDEEGEVKRMMDVYLPDGVTVADQWRGLFMLGEESEFADTFDRQTKQEFLYHLMWRLVAGGAMCQWEDSVAVYKDFVREFYKDLVSVGRNANGEVEVMSHVFQVFEVNDGEVPLFPKECGDVDIHASNFNFFYVVVNPTRREVVVFYNSFWSPF